MKSNERKWISAAIIEIIFISKSTTNIQSSVILNNNNKITSQNWNYRIFMVIWNANCTCGLHRLVTTFARARERLHATTGISPNAICVEGGVKYYLYSSPVCGRCLLLKTNSIDLCLAVETFITFVCDFKFDFISWDESVEMIETKLNLIKYAMCITILHIKVFIAEHF